MRQSAVKDFADGTGGRNQQSVQIERQQPKSKRRGKAKRFDRLRETSVQGIDERKIADARKVLMPAGKKLLHVSLTDAEPAPCISAKLFPLGIRQTPLPLAAEEHVRRSKSTKKRPGTTFRGVFFDLEVVPRDRIELPTRGFSVPCSTN